MHYNVLILNQLEDCVKRKKKSYLSVKVDFHKAYDFVLWGYLKFILERMGFRSTWLKWLDALVFTSSISILVNGIPTIDLKVFKGLRQGDPLSHFLSLMAAKGLTKMVQKAISLGDLTGF